MSIPQEPCWCCQQQSCDCHIEQAEIVDPPVRVKGEPIYRPFCTTHGKLFEGDGMTFPDWRELQNALDARNQDEEEYVLVEEIWG